MTKKDYELLKEKHEKAINRYFNLLQQFNPYTVKAKYVTCRKCGSRFNTSMMLKQPLSTSAPYKCPVCKNSEGLYSQTANKRIKQAYEAYLISKKKVDKAAAELTSSENDTRTFTDACNECEDRLEIIYKVTNTPDFREYHGEIGGDALVLRAYKDGYVCEK